MYAQTSFFKEIKLKETHAYICVVCPRPATMEEPGGIGMEVGADAMGSPGSPGSPGTTWDGDGCLIGDGISPLDDPKSSFRPCRTSSAKQEIIAIKYNWYKSDVLCVQSL